MRYEILTGTSETLEEKVQKYLDHGWELYGAPFRLGARSPDAMIMVGQAVIKRSRPKPPSVKEETE